MTYANVYSEKPDHHYRTEVPNIVFELNLNAYAFKIYSYLKKIAGDEGACFKSLASINEDVGMSKNTYLKYRNELAQPFKKLNGMPLIRIEERKKKDGSSDTPFITIVPIWRINGDYYRSKKRNTSSSHEQPSLGEVVHPVNNRCSPGEPKEEPIKKIQKKKKNISSDTFSNEKGQEHVKPTLSPPNIKFNPSTCSYDNIRPQDLDRWKIAYPDIEIQKELSKSIDWLIANPSKAKKSNWSAFLQRWFTKVQQQNEYKTYGNQKKSRKSTEYEQKNQQKVQDMNAIW